jgi:oligoendopeptidase F
MPVSRFVHHLSLTGFERLSPQGKGGSPVERSAIEDCHKWNLELIFADWENWEAAFTEIEVSLPGLAALQGTLSASGKGLLGAIEAIHNAERLLEKTYVFASMKSDEDTRIGKNTARLAHDD